MQFYDVKVQLRGDNDGMLFTEVHKKDVSAAEVLVLKGIHGDSNVRMVAKADARNVDGTKERERLAYEYGRLSNANREILKNTFGPGHMPLPLEVTGFVDPNEPAPKRKVDKAPVVDLMV